MQQPTSPRRGGWFQLGLALLVFGFGLVFGSLALGWFPLAEDGLRSDGALGARLMAGGVAAVALFMTVYLAVTALRGRPPEADDERGRIAQRWSTADGGSVTVYRQAIRRGLVNLAAGVAASLMVIGFFVGGLLLGEGGFVLIAGLMGLLIVPSTVRGIWQFLFDPVVLELGRSGIRARGQRLVPWTDVKALRIEEYRPPRRRVVRDPQAGQSSRRLGILFRHDPGTFSLASAMTGGAYSRVGVNELELPVSIEEVLEQARAYVPDIEVQGTPLPAVAAATPDAPAFGSERADAQAVRWKGATVVPALVRRRLRDGALGLLSQLGGLVVVAIGLASSGAGAALPLVLGVFAAIIIAIQVSNSGFGTLRAARAAAARSYTVTETFLVTETGEQRHERRLASLPPLVLSMERDGIGTISFELPRPAVPEWIRRLSPLSQRPTGLLLESIPGAERVFQMLQASVSSATPAAVPTELASTAPGGASEPSEPPLLPGRAWTLQRFGAFIPWWGGLIFFGLGMFMVIAIVSSPQNGPVIVIVLFPLVFAVMGAWILWSNLSVTLTRRRLLASGTVVMARVIGLADASAEVNGEDQWAVRYEYDAGGQTQTGDSPFMSQAAAMRWATGDRVSVRYDPARPEVSIWLGGDPASGS